MIIDLILDRKCGSKYNPREFYHEVREYEEVLGMKTYISEAMDYGEEVDVRKALCRYIREGEYNPEICDYINSVKWL